MFEIQSESETVLMLFAPISFSVFLLHFSFKERKGFCITDLTPKEDQTMLNLRRVQPWHVAIGLGSNLYVCLSKFILSCSTGVNDALL